MNNIVLFRYSKWTVLFSTILFLICCDKNDFGNGSIPDPTVPGKHFAYVKNYADYMWIGTYSDSIGNIMKGLEGEGRAYWIGGGVIPDIDQGHKFYFDPNTILIAEVTAEGMQTTIGQIRQDPEYYHNNGWSNGLTDHAWYIESEVIKYRVSP